MSPVYFDENTDMNEGISTLVEMLENLSAATGNDDDEGFTFHFSSGGISHEIVFADLITEAGGRIEIEIHASHDDVNQTDRLICAFTDAIDSDITFDVECTREGGDINVYDSMNYLGGVIYSALNSLSSSDKAA